MLVRTRLTKPKLLALGLGLLIHKESFFLQQAMKTVHSLPVTLILWTARFYLGYTFLYQRATGVQFNMISLLSHPAAPSRLHFLTGSRKVLEHVCWDTIATSFEKTICHGELLSKNQSFAFLYWPFKTMYLFFPGSWVKSHSNPILLWTVFIFIWFLSPWLSLSLSNK